MVDSDDEKEDDYIDLLVDTFKTIPYYVRHEYTHESRQLSVWLDGPKWKASASSWYAATDHFPKDIKWSIHAIEPQ